MQTNVDYLCTYTTENTSTRYIQNIKCQMNCSVYDHIYSAIIF